MGGGDLTDDLTIGDDENQFLTGVMNLRCTVVPVVDLRAKFGLPIRPHERFV